MVYMFKFKIVNPIFSESSESFCMRNVEENKDIFLYNLFVKQRDTERQQREIGQVWREVLPPTV